tara:strand:- start:1393 stop:1749 length:357 start_codon:yes stop_codon:yes gene_type:complete
MARREFPGAVKVAAALRAGGNCEGTLEDGTRCGLKLQTGRFHYDHTVPDGIGGEPTLANCAVLCLRCHGEKTTKIDVPRVAKMKRQRNKHLGIRKVSSLTHPTLKRRMDGSVVRRETR